MSKKKNYNSGRIEASTENDNDEFMRLGNNILTRIKDPAIHAVAVKFAEVFHKEYRQAGDIGWLRGASMIGDTIIFRSQTFYDFFTNRVGRLFAQNFPKIRLTYPNQNAPKECPLDSFSRECRDAGIPTPWTDTASIPKMGWMGKILAGVAAKAELDAAAIGPPTGHPAAMSAADWRSMEEF